MYDLVIVGGGLVGMSLAFTLQDTSSRVALIDALPFKSDDPRLFALNKASCQLLKNLKLWPYLDPYASAIHDVHVSFQGQFGSLRLSREDLDVDYLGQVIPALSIEKAFHSEMIRLQKTDFQLDIFRPAILKELSQNQEGATLTIQYENKETILKARLVIGADGTNSTVRTLTHIPTQTFDYQQKAIVSMITLNRSHQQRAYERFYPKGAIAMLPLSKQNAAMIWSADQETIAELMQLSDTLFLQTLQTEFGYRLGRLEKIGVRHCFPLQMVQTEKIREGCVILLGNAAHTLHPIAAQGLNYALYEVAYLSETIKHHLSKHEKIDASVLQKLCDSMQKKQGLSKGISHGLARISANPSRLLRKFLALGMMGFDMTSPIKKRFMEQVITGAGRVPRLLLGNEYEETISN